LNFCLKIKKKVFLMLRFGISTLCAIILLGGMTASCKRGSNIPPPAIFTTEVFLPLAINARSLKIIDNWQMPIADPYVGHRVNPLPSNVLADWASHVLSPAGGSGEIIFDMKRVAITMTDLPKKVGVNDLFLDQQSKKITAEIRAQIIWLQPVGGTQARIDLDALHSITIQESANPNEVSLKTHESMKGALVRLDRQVRKELAMIDKIILP
jgi:hypothetical protein